PATLIVQHIRPGFIESTVERLERLCRPRVLRAVDGEAIVRGRVYLASDPTRHLVLAGRGTPRCRLVAEPPLHGHRPSIDRLFHSAVPYAAGIAAALLTGMGADGASGLKALRLAGAYTVVQDRTTSVVWGMPRVAAEMGAAVAVLPLDRIAGALLSGSVLASPRTTGSPGAPR
ncbi:MAG: CheB methylesterase domain-containing protein, partial [Dehalococcoidia bacterium]|nr:CheB methylesterase domain-containing protein [Dehalococcoidia bacterium]